MTTIGKTRLICPSSCCLSSLVLLVLDFPAVADLPAPVARGNQAFLLESPVLGTHSDLRAALENLGAAFPWKIVRADDKVATFTRPGNPQPVLLSAGTALDGVTLIQITDGELLVCDGDRWLRLPAPKP